MHSNGRATTLNTISLVDGATDLAGSERRFCFNAAFGPRPSQPAKLCTRGCDSANGGNGPVSRLTATDTPTSAMANHGPHRGERGAALPRAEHST